MSAEKSTWGSVQLDIEHGVLAPISSIGLSPEGAAKLERNIAAADLAQVIALLADGESVRGQLGSMPVTIRAARHAVVQRPDPGACPEDTWDLQGYPTEAFIAWLTATPRPVEAFWQAAQYFQECAYGHAAIVDGVLHMSTGGWSGCEDVIDALQANLGVWHMTWRETHRGGHYRFVVDNLQL